MRCIHISNRFLRARLVARGAALVGLWRAGWAPSVVLSTDPPALFQKAHPFGGTVVGPVANRVGGAVIKIG